MKQLSEEAWRILSFATLLSFLFTPCANAIETVEKNRHIRELVSSSSEFQNKSSSNDSSEEKSKFDKRTISQVKNQISEAQAFVLTCKFEAAIDLFKSAIKDLETFLGDNNDPRLEILLASSLQEQGDVQRKVGMISSAIQSYDQAVSIYRTLVKTSPDKEVVTGLARVLLNRGDLYQDNNNSSAALNDYLNSRKLIRDLISKEFSEEQLVEYSSTLCHLATLRIKQKQFIEAQNLYLEALASFENKNLVVHDKQAFLIAKTKLLIEIGNFEFKSHYKNTAATRFKLAEQSLNAFLSLNPNSFQARELKAIYLLNLSSSLEKEKQDGITTAIKLLDEVLKEDPNKVSALQLKAEVLSALAQIHHNRSEVQAVSLLEESANVFDRILKIEPKLLKASYGKASVLLKLGKVLRYRSNLETAILDFKLANEEFKKIELVQPNYLNVKRNIKESYREVKLTESLLPKSKNI